MRPKITWVDILKGIGIIAVVIGHLRSPFTRFIYSWHMPLFFFLAGFFINPEVGFKKFFQQSFKRLMIPYFIFGLVAISFETLKRLVYERKSLNYENEFIGLFWSMDFKGLLNHLGFGLWFLPCLFMSRFFFFGLSKMTGSRNLLTVLLCLPLFALSLKVNFPFAIDNGMNTVLWVALGNYYYQEHRESSFLHIAALISLCLLLFLNFPFIDLASKTYEAIPLNFLRASSMICILIFVTRWLSKFKLPVTFLSFWGGHSMFIFLIHPYTNDVADSLVGLYSYNLWWLNLLVSMALLYILLLIERRFPKNEFLS